MGKKSLAGVLITIAVLAGLAWYLYPELFTIPLTHRSSTPPLISTTTTLQTTTKTTQGGSTTQTETQATSPKNASAVSEGVAKLPKLATNVTLKEIERIIVGNVTSATQEKEEGLCSSAPCNLVLEYYNKVKNKDLNLTPLFDTSLLNETALIELHKALYEKYTLMNYSITWLFDQHPEESDITFPGYDEVYVLPYNFTGIYEDTSGSKYIVATRLVTFVGYNQTTGQMKILQTISLESNP